MSIIRQLLFKSRCFRPRRLLLYVVFFVYVLIFINVLKQANDNSFLHNNSKNKTTTTTEPNLQDTLAEPPNGRKAEVIAVLVLVCDRVTVTRTLAQLIKYRPNKDKFPLVLSQDCGTLGKRVKRVVKSLYPKLTYLTHPFYNAIRARLKETDIPEHMLGYYHIAAHYGWALNYTFDKLGYDNVIVVEDDLDIAPDFFEYFDATLPILKSDPTLWCVSAYNDNGRAPLFDETKKDLLYRTDFFPGLGWMLTKELWKELGPNWPGKFWDDWMRNSKRRKGRACIHPEVSRTKTYGEKGTSQGQYFQKYLKNVVLNMDFVPFVMQNLSYLRKAKYDTKFLSQVNSARLVQSLQEFKEDIVHSPAKSYKLKYKSELEFTLIAREVGLMDDFKDGVPRNGYMGIVPFHLYRKVMYLVPHNFSTSNGTVEV